MLHDKLHSSKNNVKFEVEKKTSSNIRPQIELTLCKKKKKTRITIGHNTNNYFDNATKYYITFNLIDFQDKKILLVASILTIISTL